MVYISMMTAVNGVLQQTTAHFGHPVAASSRPRPRLRLIYTLLLRLPNLVSARLCYTIHPVVKPVEQPVEQTAASCKQTFNRLFNQLFNRFNNRMYRVNGVLEGHN